MPMNNTERKRFALEEKKVEIRTTVKKILNYMQHGLRVNSEKINTLQNQFDNGINLSLTMKDLLQYKDDNYLSGGDMLGFISKHIEE